MSTVAVAVLAGDRVTEEGAAARLSSHPGIAVLAPEHHHRASVLVIITTKVTEAVLRSMERACGGSASGELSVVLIADDISDHQILRAVNAGLVSLLYRGECDYRQIVRAIQAASASRAQLPETILRRLIDQVRAVQRDVLALNGLTVTGLAVREVEVLRLLSEGLGTEEVAAKLNYSVRTVKNIVHGVATRLNLRNRTHAVAYALRSGAL
ncbi:MAG TPA: response regulator transcription factor [Streptosporangiaceae bacterium]|nr:response regulator transcription factor [Streptosporangiaceae bacterium]